MGRWTKVYVQKRWMPSSDILHQFCLTRGSTLRSHDYNPSFVVYVSKPDRAIWRYLLSKFCALLCCSFCQYCDFCAFQFEKIINLAHERLLNIPGRHQIWINIHGCQPNPIYASLSVWIRTLISVHLCTKIISLLIFR